MHPPVMRGVAIPVRPCERLLPRDHRSTAGAPPVVRAQDRGPTPRSRVPGHVAVTPLNVRLPGRSDGVGVPRDRDVARRWDHRPNADDPCPGGWSGAPPGFPRSMGQVALRDPGPGGVGVAPLRPSLAPSPDAGVEGGAWLAPDDLAVIVRPPPHHGGQGLEAWGRGVSRGVLTERCDPRLEGLEADRAGRHRERAPLAVGSRIWASRRPAAGDARGAGRDAGGRR